MKKLFKNWNLFEIIMLAVSLLVIVVCFAFTEDKSALSLISSLVGVVYVMFVAKGLISAQILNLVYLTLYLIVSFQQALYGEVIVQIVVVLPMTIYTLISWFKNRSATNNDMVKVNKISRKETLILALATLGIGVVFFFLLRALNTSQLVMSTITLALSVTASYLLLRRDKNCELVYTLLSVLRVGIWLVSTILYGVQYLPLVISFVVFIVLDIYGYIIWRNSEKQQTATGESLTEKTSE